MVVALKLDRISRDSYDSQWFKKYCNENECEIYLASENYDLNTLSGNMMYGITSLFAEHERKEIGRRTKRGLNEIARQGKYPQKAPIGYVRNAEGFLEVETLGAEVVRDVFKYYSEGMSANAIAEKMLNEQRYYGTTGNWEERIGKKEK